MARKRRRGTRTSERISGGLAPGGRCPAGIPAREIERGIKVELEHTHDRRIAREIACDHFTEHGVRYYRALARMERTLRSRR